MKDLELKLKKAMEYLKADVKKDMGIQAVNHFRKSFRDEGFTDRNVSKWKAVKRSSNGKGAARGRKILTGETKQLADSIGYRVSPRGVVITSGVRYAKIHNEGGSAGRNGASKIPQRQFMGKSAVLNRLIAREIQRELNRRLNG